MKITLHNTDTNKFQRLQQLGNNTERFLHLNEKDLLMTLVWVRVSNGVNNFLLV